VNDKQRAKLRKVDCSTLLKNVKEIMMKKDDISLGVLPMKDEDDNEKKKLMTNALEAIEMMTATWADQLAVMLMRAKLDKAYYDALVTAGFTKVEALEIIKGKGV
jgi:hypothetical protein